MIKLAAANLTSINGGGLSISTTRGDRGGSLIIMWITHNKAKSASKKKTTSTQTTLGCQEYPFTPLIPPSPRAHLLPEVGVAVGCQLPPLHHLLPPVTPSAPDARTARTDVTGPQRGLHSPLRPLSRGPNTEGCRGGRGLAEGQLLLQIKIHHGL